MDIYLIRHTQTNTVKGLCYGRSDVALADSFAAEVQEIQHKLPKIYENCKVFSSPLTRCLQLAEQFSTNVCIDPRLQEINFGDWENCRFNDIEPNLLVNWTNNFVDLAPPNGESFADLCQRAGSFWHDLLISKAEQVLVITHAGIIRAMLTHILQLPAANAFHFQVDAGSVHKFKHINNFTYINGINL